MAVIREKRQYKIGTIGVARASQGGQMIGDTIARSANTLSDMFYRDAAQAAEKAGIKAGASVDPQEVITINPQTGEPEAYAPPIGMGTIGADAYQRVVMKRFQQSMEDEIRNKGKQLAAKYEGSANGAALYETAMSDYIASMTNVADNEFKGFIADAGTSYLNATKTNMGIAQIRRERAAAKVAHNARIKQNLNNIEMMIAQGGPASLQGPTVVNAAIADVSSDVGDGGQARIFNPAEINNYGKDGQMAVVRGLIRNAASKITDPDELRLMQNAIGTQNANAVPEGYPEVADAIRSFGSDFSSLAKIEKFSDGLFGDAVVNAEIEQKKEIDAQAAENAQIVFNMQNSQAGNILAEKGFAFRRGPLAVANRAIEQYGISIDNARRELANGRKGISDQMLKDGDAVMKASVTALYARTLSGLGTKDTDALENAIVNRNVMLAPESTRLELNALMRIEAATGQPVLQDFMSEISSYRSSAGKNVDSINQSIAAEKALQINLNAVTFAEDIDKVLPEIISKIKSIDNLGEEESKGMIQSAYLNAGINMIQRFMADSTLTEGQLREAKSVLEGGAIQKDTLSEDQVELLNRARSYGEEAGGVTKLRTPFNNQSDIVQKRIEEQEEKQKLSLQVQSINSGRAVPTNESNRKVYEQMLSEQYAQGQDISNLWGGSESVSNPVAINILNDVVKKGVLPESLHKGLTSLAEGEFRIGDVNAFMTHYVNIRDYMFEGQKIDNPALNAFTEGQRATLDYLADVVDVEGNITPDRLARVYTRMQEFNESDRKQEKVEALLGASLDDFVYTLDNIDDLPSSAVNAMKAATLDLIAVGASSKTITKRLNNQINRTYPNGDNYVVNPNMGSRTKFALPLVAFGNEDLFKTHVRNVVSELSGIAEFGFGGRKIRTERGFKTPEDNVYLVPLDSSSDGEVRFTVRRSRFFEEGGDEVVYGTFAEDGSEGQTTYSAPIIISNRDPAFIKAVNEAQLVKNKAEIDAARRLEEDPLRAIPGYYGYEAAAEKAIGFAESITNVLGFGGND